MLCGPIQAQYCSILLTAVNNLDGTTLFNPLKQQAHNFYACMIGLNGTYFKE